MLHTTEKKYYIYEISFKKISYDSLDILDFSQLCSGNLKEIEI